MALSELRQCKVQAPCHTWIGGEHGPMPSSRALQLLREALLDFVHEGRHVEVLVWRHL